jgi:hypothetical protein
LKKEKRRAEKKKKDMAPDAGYASSNTRCGSEVPNEGRREQRTVDSKAESFENSFSKHFPEIN